MVGYDFRQREIGSKAFCLGVWIFTDNFKLMLRTIKTPRMTLPPGTNHRLLILPHSIAVDLQNFHTIYKQFSFAWFYMAIFYLWTQIPLYRYGGFRYSSPLPPTPLTLRFPWDVVTSFAVLRNRAVMAVSVCVETSGYLYQSVYRRIWTFSQWLSTQGWSHNNVTLTWRVYRNFKISVCWNYAAQDCKTTLDVIVSETSRYLT